MDKEAIAYLKYLHGLFNFTVMLLLFYHARLGLTIRRERLAKGPFPLNAVKRHRALGPVLTLLGIAGFAAGAALILMDEGKILKYPLHFFVGLIIVGLLISTYALSRRIKGPDSPLRTPHFRLGVAILSSYVIQAFLGLGILF